MCQRLAVQTEQRHHYFNAARRDCHAQTLASGERYLISVGLAPSQLAFDRLAQLKRADFSPGLLGLAARLSRGPRCKQQYTPTEN